jgi:tRNA(fMet)-specific endonuclease VapC
VRILDTDVCVEILRGSPRVLERRRAIRDEVGTTTMTAAELFFGAARSVAPTENGALVRAFLASLAVHGLDVSAAEIFGELKAGLARAGRTLADADLIIASIALAHGAILVTGNRQHYERVPMLAIEDWLRPTDDRAETEGRH